jgi:hypothetical protein
MPFTKVDIANQALGWVGQLSEESKIEDFDEDSDSAQVVRRYYDSCLESFLEKAWWSFATAYAELSLLDLTKPLGWAYVYSRPADSIMPRRIIGALPDDVIPYEEAISGETPVIYTNQQLAFLEYTKRHENFTIWSGSAREAFILKLALSMAPAVTGGMEKTRLLSALYASELEDAMVASHNRQVRDPHENESSEFTDGRFGTVEAIRHSAVFKRG